MSMSSRNAVSVTERERRLAARTEQWLVGKVEDYLDKQRFSANPQWPYEFNVKQPSKSALARSACATLIRPIVAIPICMSLSRGVPPIVRGSGMR